MYRFDVFNSAGQKVGTVCADSRRDAQAAAKRDFGNFVVVQYTGPVAQPLAAKESRR